MKQFIRTLFVLFLCGLLLVTQWACVRTKTGFHENLGVIGVTMAQFPPEWYDPSVKKHQRRGGGIGGGLEGLILGVALLLLIVLAYGVHHAFENLFDSPDDSQEIPKSPGDNPDSMNQTQEKKVPGNWSEFTRRAFLSLRMQETFYDTFVAQARTSTPYQFVLLPESGPKNRLDTLTYKELAGRGLDTILELRIMEVGLYGRSGGEEASFMFSMKGRARLISIVNGLVLHNTELTHNSEWHPFREWAENNGQKFQEAITNAYEDLAHKIIYNIFKVQATTDQPPQENFSPMHNTTGSAGPRNPPPLPFSSFKPVPFETFHKKVDPHGLGFFISPS